MELCYIGILAKCFEILETGSSDEDNFPDIGSQQAALTTSWFPGDLNGESDSEDDSIHDQLDEDDEGDDGNDDNNTTAEAVDEDDTDSHNGSDGRSELSVSDQGNGEMTRLRLREILFYTEKIEIFKAQRGTL